MKNHIYKIRCLICGFEQESKPGESYTPFANRFFLAHYAEHLDPNVISAFRIKNMASVVNNWEYKR